MWRVSSFMFLKGVWRCLQIEMDQMRHATLLFCAEGVTVRTQAREKIKMKKSKSIPMVEITNLWPAIPYLVRISVAKKDPTYKHPTDARYDGWREIWAKCDIELFDRVLNKKLRDVYLVQLLDYANSLPMVCSFMKKLNVMAADSVLVSSAYRYYGTHAHVTHRIGVELILKTVLSLDFQ